MTKFGKCHCRVNAVSDFILDLSIVWPTGDTFDLVDWPSDAPVLINPTTGQAFTKAYVQRPAQLTIRRAALYKPSAPYGLALKQATGTRTLIQSPATIPLPRAIYGSPLTNDPSNTSSSPLGHTLGSKPILTFVSEQPPLGQDIIQSTLVIAQWADRAASASTDDLGVLVPTDVHLPDLYPANEPDNRFNNVRSWYFSGTGVKMQARLDLPPRDIGPDGGGKISPGGTLTLQVRATFQF